VWRPATPVPPPSGAIGLFLWTALCERTSRGFPVGDQRIVELGADDVPWLHGFIAGSNNDDDLADARALLTALDQHGRIVIEVEW
jgi:hypothetical protein